MKTSVEPLEGNLVKLTVTVPAADVDKAIAEAYAKRRQAGARPRVPHGQGAAAGHRHATSAASTCSPRRRRRSSSARYAEAIDAEDLRPIDQPDVGELTGSSRARTTRTWPRSSVRPELDADRRLDAPHGRGPAEGRLRARSTRRSSTMRERFATLEPVEDRGVEIGDFVAPQLRRPRRRRAVRGQHGRQVPLRDWAAARCPQEFDDALIGAKPGDEVAAEFVIPETSSEPGVRRQDRDVRHHRARDQGEAAARARRRVRRATRAASTRWTRCARTCSERLDDSKAAGPHARARARRARRRSPSVSRATSPSRWSTDRA